MSRPKTTPTTIDPKTHVRRVADEAIARIDAELAEHRARREAEDLTIAALEAQRAIYAGGPSRPNPSIGVFETVGNGGQ